MNTELEQEVAQRLIREQFRKKCLELNNEFLETHRQMLVNNHYAGKYKSALNEIINLLGPVQSNNPSCIGPPPDDFDEIALRLVYDKLFEHQKIKRTPSRTCGCWLCRFRKDRQFGKVKE